MILRPRNPNAGFSLIEVICAILIVGIALVGLTRGVATALRSSKESEVQTTAALIAAGRIEILRADGFLAEGTSTGQSDFNAYSWRQALTKTSVDGLFNVTVTVMDTRNGKTIFTLQTMLFEIPFENTGIGSREDKRQQRGERKSS
jgi:prepilin-type N-terminal cleavage/methylation domain-containing protein